MREIAIISGKGGTGKSSFVLSLLPFVDDLVIADCDVDSPDINVLLAQDYQHKTPFKGFKTPLFDYDKCTKCGLCKTHCHFNTITDDITLAPSGCEGCTLCAVVCPVDAITMTDHVIGHTFIRNTAYGPLIDARLFPGEESSGKLVTEVRKQSQEALKKHHKQIILIDGSPGVACNVISTITGVDKVYIVTEPTISGLHDLKRVRDLIAIFQTPVTIILNKIGLNEVQEQNLKTYCYKEGLDIALEIPYDKRISQAISNLEIPSLSDIPFFRSPQWQNFIIAFKKDL